MVLPLSAVSTHGAYPVFHIYSYLFILLILYSFLGWCGEMIYCSLGQGRLCEKRGFLNGPLCPIYGHGALLVLIVLDQSSTSPLITFFWGAILTSSVEYITSYMMERLFHMRWWDYSQKRFNLNGRVCLLNSTLFGLACVLLCHVVQPYVSQYLFHLFDRGMVMDLLSLIICAVYLIDIVLSVRSAIQISSRLEKLHAIHDELSEKLEHLKAEQQQALEAQKERLEEFVLSARQSAGERGEETAQHIQAKLERLKEEQQRIRDSHRARLEAAKSDAQQRLKTLYDKPDIFERRLLRSFPTMRSLHHGEALNKMREYLESRKG